MVPGVKGCVVANAHPELLSFAERNTDNANVFKVCWVDLACSA